MSRREMNSSVFAACYVPPEPRREGNRVEWGAGCVFFVFLAVMVFLSCAL